MDIPNDWKELLELLNENEVEYLIVGAFALALYGIPRLTDDIDGLFKDYDWMRYYPQSPPLTFLHEYWAASDKAARKLLDYAWRIIPETDPPVKKYLGIFVGSFNMVFTDSTVTHDPGPRYSGDGPP